MGIVLDERKRGFYVRGHTVYRKSRGGNIVYRTLCVETARAF